MKSLAAVFAPALLSSAAAVSFVAPFNQNSDFQLSGDAADVGNAVQLVHAPQQRGAVWMKTPVATEEWTLEAVLRSKPDLRTDVGRSGFSVWYTSKPNALGAVHGGADKWDGLAVMMDSIGSSAAVRGHLNDGSYQFEGAVENDALSLCRVDYRNAAGPITIRVAYSHEGFVVDVNGAKCFMTTEVSLSSGYFGVSADSDVSGDILSVERMEVTAGMKPDIAAHLPQHADERQKAPDAAAQPRKESSGSAAGSQAVDAADVKAAIAPALTRLELVDQRLTRLDSVVNQLVDTLSVSLAEVAGDRSSQSSSDLDNGVQKELKAIRSQISELRRSMYAEQPELPGIQKGPSTWSVVVVVMLAQFAAVFLYSTFRSRRRRHEKLI